MYDYIYNSDYSIMEEHSAWLTSKHGGQTVKKEVSTQALTGVC